MAIISPPGIGPIDRQDAQGRNIEANPGWRKFFTDVYNICSAMVNSGPSANRPDSLLWVGKPFWDDTLQQDVYWNGFNWTSTAPSQSSSAVNTSYTGDGDTGAFDYPMPGMMGPRGLQGFPGPALRGDDGAEGETLIITASNQITTPWRDFTPVRTGWTDVGSPTVTGLQCRIENVCYFQVKVVPGTTVATVAGTSYIDLPLTASGVAGDGSMMNITTLIGVGVCAIDVATSRVYVPTQGATGNPLTVAGWYNV